MAQWRVGAALALVTIGIGATIALALPPVYQSEAFVVVRNAKDTPVAPPPGPLTAIFGRALSAQDAVTEFAKSDIVKQALIESVPPPKEIDERLVAHAVTGTNLVELRVIGSDPRRVAMVGDAWARVVDAKSHVMFATKDPVVLQLVADAAVPRSPVAPQRLVIVANYVVLGFFVGVVSMLALADYRERQRSRDTRATVPGTGDTREI